MQNIFFVTGAHAHTIGNACPVRFTRNGQDGKPAMNPRFCCYIAVMFFRNESYPQLDLDVVMAAT